MQARLDRARASPDTNCNLINAQIAVVAKREYDPMVGPQALHSRPQQVAIMGWAELVNCYRMRLCPKVVTATPRNLPKAISAGVHQDPLEPALEELGIAELRPIAPGGDEGVVRRILCLRALPEDRMRETVAGVQMPIGKVTKCGFARGPRESFGDSAILHSPDPKGSHAYTTRESRETFRRAENPHCAQRGASARPASRDRELPDGSLG